MGLLNVVVHGDMLLDERRNAALATAIAEVVRPGDVVVDLGAGTGLLSMLAARAGASRVYAVERGPMAVVARTLVRRNGMDGVVEVVRADSREFRPDRPADVLLCETLGMACLDEGFRATVVDGRDRMLRPGGTVVPSHVDVWVAPVRWSPERNRIGALDSLLGFDFSLFGELVRAVHRRVHLDEADLLAPPDVAFHLDCLAMRPDDGLTAEATFVASAEGVLGGFALWFEASLSPSARLTSWGPGPRNHWGQALLPGARAVPVAADEKIRLVLAIDDRPGQFRIRWETETEAGR